VSLFLEEISTASRPRRYDERDVSFFNRALRSSSNLLFHFVSS
jgi:hypothetical protein